MSEQIFLRATKVWQGHNNELIWQISLDKSASLTTGQKKAFLIVSPAGQSHSPIKWNLTKPEIKEAGPLVNIMRKHAKTCTIRGAFYNDQTKTTAIKLTSGPKEFWIFIDNARPQFLHVIDSDKGLSLIRTNASSTYTKPQPYPIAELQSWTQSADDCLPKISTPDLPVPNDVVVLSDKASTNTKPVFQKTLQKSLKRRLKTLKKSLAKAKSSLANSREFKTTLHHAELLRDHQHLYQPNMSQFIVASDAAPESPITIDLNPDKTLGQNIDQLFTIAKKQKAAIEHLEAEVTRIEFMIRQLNSTITSITDTTITYQETEVLRKKFRLRPQQFPDRPDGKHASTAKPFRIFKSSEGIPILVGKGPRENDILTKNAKSNDYWFHVVGTTGSHVIIAADRGLRDNLPNATKRQAGILALHFSKIRTDLAGECYFARKHGIRKQKGMPAGLWSVQSAETLYIKYQEQELRDILGSADS